MPKFSVEIDSPAHFYVRDGKIRTIIRSKYTYGQFVKGRTVVTLTPASFHTWSQGPKTKDIIKAAQFDGKKTIEFDILEDLDAQLNEEQRNAVYEMRAVVFEELTNRNQSTTKRIYLHLKRYKFNAIDQDSQFQIGLPVRVNVAVTYQDNKPVMANEANKNIVIVKVPNNQKLSETFFKHELTPNGTVEAYIPTDKIDESGFTMLVSFIGPNKIQFTD